MVYCGRGYVLQLKTRAVCWERGGPCIWIFESELNIFTQGWHSSRPCAVFMNHSAKADILFTWKTRSVYIVYADLQGDWKGALYFKTLINFSRIALFFKFFIRKLNLYSWESIEVLIFMPDGALLHFVLGVHKWLNAYLPGRWIGRCDLHKRPAN